MQHFHNEHGTMKSQNQIMYHSQFVALEQSVKSKIESQNVDHKMSFEYDKLYL